MNARNRFLFALFFLLTFCTFTRSQTSDPLNQWEVIASPNISIRGLAYQRGHFAAGGVTTSMIVSTNGRNWILVPSSVTNSQAGILAVAEGQDKFVAVGSGGLILSSPDGLQWTHLRKDWRDEYWAIIYAGGQFVVVGFFSEGDAQITKAVALTSADGVQWERFEQQISTTPRNVAYGNGLYVAAGVPMSMYSRNGRDWTPLSGVYAQGIAYGGGQFIATLVKTGYRSSNGLDWTEISLPTLRSGNEDHGFSYFTATYANGLFLIGGYCENCPGTGNPAVLGTSTDGKQWMSRTLSTNIAVGPLRDIVFVDGTTYIADQRGRIWKSGRAAPSAPPEIKQVTHADGQTTLSFAVVPGFHYVLECAETPDATSWASCSEPLFAIDDHLSVTDHNATTQTRFYRIRVE